MRRVVISGCSGGGKSTLIGALSDLGYQTFAEPGRRVVREEQASGGNALPWVDGAAFGARVIKIALADWHATTAATSFYDRSCLDALAWFERSGTAPPMGGEDIAKTHRYDPVIFMVPPWKDIFCQDEERQHSFETAVAEYDALMAFYPANGYQVKVIPKNDVQSRVTFVLDALT